MNSERLTAAAAIVAAVALMAFLVLAGSGRLPFEIGPRARHSLSPVPSPRANSGQRSRFELPLNSQCILPASPVTATLTRSAASVTLSTAGHTWVLSDALAPARNNAGGYGDSASLFRTRDGYFFAPDEHTVLRIGDGDVTLEAYEPDKLKFLPLTEPFADHFTRDDTADQGEWRTNGGVWKVDSAPDPAHSASPFHLEASSDVPASLVVGHPASREYLFRVAARTGSKPCALGVCVGGDHEDGIVAAWHPISDWYGEFVVERQGARLGSRYMKLNRDQWYEFAVALAGGRLYLTLDSWPLFVLEAPANSGSAGLFVDGGTVAFDDATMLPILHDAKAEFETGWRETLWEQRIAANGLPPELASDDSNHIWASRTTLWRSIGRKGRTLVSRHSVNGDFEVRILLRRPSEIPTEIRLDADVVQGPVLKLSQDLNILLQTTGETAVLPTPPSWPAELVVGARGHGDPVPFARVGSQSVSFRPVSRATVQGSIVVEMRDGGISPRIYSSSLLDLSFSTAPTAFNRVAGKWLVSSRWACSPQYSWLGGLGEPQAGLLSKFDVQGDYTLDCYLAPLMIEYMRPGYRHPGRISISVGEREDGSPADSFSLFSPDIHVLKSADKQSTLRSPQFMGAQWFHNLWFNPALQRSGANLLASFMNSNTRVRNDGAPGPLRISFYDSDFTFARLILSATSLPPRKPLGLDEQPPSLSFSLQEGTTGLLSPTAIPLSLTEPSAARVEWVELEQKLKVAKVTPSGNGGPVELPVKLKDLPESFGPPSWPPPLTTEYLALVFSAQRPEDWEIRFTVSDGERVVPLSGVYSSEDYGKSIDTRLFTILPVKDDRLPKGTEFKALFLAVGEATTMYEEYSTFLISLSDVRLASRGQHAGGASAAPVLVAGFTEIIRCTDFELGKYDWNRLTVLKPGPLVPVVSVSDGLMSANVVPGEHAVFNYTPGSNRLEVLLPVYTLNIWDGFWSISHRDATQPGASKSRNTVLDPSRLVDPFTISHNLDVNEVLSQSPEPDKSGGKLALYQSFGWHRTEVTKYFELDTSKDHTDDKDGPAVKVRTIDSTEFEDTASLNSSVALRPYGDSRSLFPELVRNGDTSTWLLRKRAFGGFSGLTIDTTRLDIREHAAIIGRYRAYGEWNLALDMAKPAQVSRFGGISSVRPFFTGQPAHKGPTEWKSFQIIISEFGVATPDELVIGDWGFPTGQTDWWLEIADLAVVPVVYGDSTSFTVEASDLSGVERIEYALASTGSNILHAPPSEPAQWVPCEPGEVVVSGLKGGYHWLFVRAVDGRGNISPVRTWQFYRSDYSMPPPALNSTMTERDERVPDFWYCKFDLASVYCDSVQVEVDYGGWKEWEVPEFKSTFSHGAWAIHSFRLQLELEKAVVTRVLAMGLDGSKLDILLMAEAPPPNPALPKPDDNYSLFSASLSRIQRLGDDMLVPISRRGSAVRSDLGWEDDIRVTHIMATADRDYFSATLVNGRYSPSEYPIVAFDYRPGAGLMCLMVRCGPEFYDVQLGGVQVPMRFSEQEGRYRIAGAYGYSSGLLGKAEFAPLDDGWYGVRIDLYALLRAKFGDKADKMSVDEIALRAAGANPVRTAVQVRDLQVYNPGRDFYLDLDFWGYVPGLVNLKVRLSRDDGSSLWLTSDGKWSNTETELTHVSVVDALDFGLRLELRQVPEGYNMITVEGEHDFSDWKAEYFVELEIPAP